MELLFPLFLLQLFGSVAVGEVVQSFTGDSCRQFFIADPSDQNVHYPPTILRDDQNPERYKLICQLWDNKYRYATLYDTMSRIPIYSAYHYVGYKKGTKADWKIEPQLDDITQGKEMAREETVDIKVRGKEQALYDDYARQKVYTRGHLYPRCHSADQECAIATYTHTNAVPQTTNDNNEWNSKVETKMEKSIKETCAEGNANIVTGAVPGNSWMEIMRESDLIQNGVNIPQHFWTAYCCRDKNSIDLVARAWLATRVTNRLIVRKMKVQELEAELGKLYQTPEEEFKIFAGLCKTPESSSFLSNTDNFISMLLYFMN